MTKLNDLTGIKFGKLTVIERDASQTKRTFWICKCDCGNEKSIYGSSLLNEFTKSCGCIRASRKDISGNKYNSLTVLNFEYMKDGCSYWNCQCECGNTKVIRSTDITTGRTKSCGCYRKSGITRKRKEIDSNRKRLLQIFSDMKYRCYNEKFKEFHNYGGRGITVCKEWKDDFELFMKWSIENGYSENLTIDRKDVNGNYEPDNCRWITNQEQQNNRRNNVRLIHKGVTKTLAEWERFYGIRLKTITKWISRGWDNEKIFNKLEKIGVNNKND